MGILDILKKTAHVNHRDVDVYFVGGPRDGGKVKANRPVITVFYHHDGINECQYFTEYVVYNGKGVYFLIHESLINSDSKIDLISKRLGELERGKEI